MLVIQNTKDRDLFWSNDDGWTDRESADVFKEIETGTLNLPMDGEWVDSRIGFTYRIQRFYRDPNKESETMQTGLTFQEAREHCNDQTSQGEDWFDGFEVE